MRTLNATALALLVDIQAGAQVPLVQLLQLDFDPIERYTTAGSDVQWSGQTWSSLAVQIEAVQDTVGDLPAITLTLPGVPSSIVSAVLSDAIDGTACHIYDALLDPATGVVADAVLAWSGVLNQPLIEDGARASVSITAEHRGVLALRAKPSRYTDDEQQRLHAGDTSLATDPATDAAPLVWPAASYWRR